LASQVLKDITWTVRAGERWHLQGYNGARFFIHVLFAAIQTCSATGSGKTTLTSLLTGAHPQSYTQQHLHLFGSPRKRIATPTLSQLIGHTSPELAAAVPRRTGFTTSELVATGFDGHFAFRRRTSEERARIEHLLAQLDLSAEKPVNELSPGELACALLLRAIVSRPKLVLLDEAFSGMGKRQVEQATKLLRNEGELGSDQAIVWIGHWEGECPWGVNDGLRRIRLDGGHAEIIA